MNNAKKRGRFTPGELPPLTDAQREELARLAALPDDQIDTSEIAELPAGQWAMASRGTFYRPTKSSITTRIDSDVLAWLKSQGGAYQSRINAILRHVMLEQVAPRSGHKVFVLPIPDQKSKDADLLKRMERDFQSATF